MQLSILLFAVLMQVPPTLPALPSPTPMPTVTAMPTFGADLPSGAIYEFLSTASANVNAMPEDISAPGGVPVLPNDSGTTIWNYARWLFSTNAAEELVGTTMSPIALHFFVFMLFFVVLTAIHLGYSMIILLARFVLALFKTFTRAVPFLGAFVFIQMPTPTPMPIGPTPVLNIPTSNARLWNFADDAIAWWSRIGYQNTQIVQIVVIVMIVVVAAISIINLIRSIQAASNSDE